MKNTRNQTCALGSSPATAPRAATSVHYFKMTTGALSPAAISCEFPTTTTKFFQRQNFIKIFVCFIKGFVKELDTYSTCYKLLGVSLH